MKPAWAHLCARGRLSPVQDSTEFDGWGEKRKHFCQISQQEIVRSCNYFLSLKQCGENKWETSEKIIQRKGTFFVLLAKVHPFFPPCPFGGNRTITDSGGHSTPPAPKHHKPGQQRFVMQFATLATLKNKKQKQKHKQIILLLVSWL